MQTSFSLAQLADPDIAECDKILRACVHCGFCTATCPTYVLLGDELDSPRGRIYLMKEMLEKDGPVTADVVKHVDRCLSCLSCMTTCPSGVHYMHLVDHARAHIEARFRRPWADRALRALVARVLPNRRLFRFAVRGARLAQPLRRLLPGRLGRMVAMAPARVPPVSAMETPQVFRAGLPGRTGHELPVRAPRQRVALLGGCVQSVLRPSINEAAVRLLTRHGVSVVVPEGEGCCGALTHHLGHEEPALAAARANVAAWWREIEGEGLDAILITASGCGTTVKDYGFMLRNDPVWAERAAKVSALALDVTEYLAKRRLLPPSAASRLTVAYHAACSLQHGQQVRTQPKALLAGAGFVVKDVPEGHLCCGSAGAYNILQPEIADALRQRKLANIQTLRPDLVATGNIGCMTQLAGGLGVPVLHTVELLDWATGGPKPAGIELPVAAAAE